MYAYAKTGEIGPLEEFISSSHQANLQSVGDRCFEEGLYEPARIVFQHIPNYGRLASTLVKLHLFQQAVDAARKANSPRTWKEVTLFHVSIDCFKVKYDDFVEFAPFLANEIESCASAHIIQESSS